MSLDQDHRRSTSCTRYLHAAMQLEHATIPPYLTALYSIHPGTNSDAVHSSASSPSRRCCTSRSPPTS